MQRTIYGIYSFLNHQRKISLFDVWGPIMNKDDITKTLGFLIKETDYRIEKEAEIDPDKARTKSFYTLTGLEVLLEADISNAMFIHGYELLIRELWEPASGSNMPPGLAQILAKAAQGDGSIRIRGGNVDDLRKLFDKFMREKGLEPPEDDED